jgi:Transport protein particle (TRAPP) component
MSFTFPLIVLSASLNTLGYRIGTRVLELMVWRTESGSKAPKREIRFLPALMSIHTNVWKAVFGKPADAIEKSVQNEDECLSALDTYRTRLTPIQNRYDHRQRPGDHS